jgi:threonine/homoserine/homoserine lactone efflux protein
MLGIQNYSLFVLGAMLLIISPGQDTLYIVGRSVAQGRGAGLLSVFGICCGEVVHVIAAALGLSALLVASASAFTTVKILGAVYLVYLGVKMWFEPPSNSEKPAEYIPAGAWEIFRAGMLSNLLNPKVALFNLAFLPQFVAPDSEHKIFAMLFLGGTCLFTGTIWCVFLAIAAAAGVSARLRAHSRAGVILRKAIGSLFVGLGVKLALNK